MTIAPCEYAKLSASYRQAVYKLRLKDKQRNVATPPKSQVSAVDTSKLENTEDNSALKITNTNSPAHRKNSWSQVSLVFARIGRAQLPQDNGIDGIEHADTTPTWLSIATCLKNQRHQRSIRPRNYCAQ
jgi:hypothetical protein